MGAPTQTQSRLRESLERLKPDTHSCLIYQSPEQQFAAAVPFMELGLERGEKCIYVSAENNPGDVLAAMRAGGIDTSSAIESGALTLVSAGESAASPARAATALDLLAQAVASAAGYAGVRVAREVAWQPGEAVDEQQLATFERRLESCFTGQKYLDVAQFDSRHFPPQTLLSVIRTHPVVIWDGTVCENLHASLPGEQLAPYPTAQEVERVLANLRDRQLVENSLRAQVAASPLLPVQSLLSGRPSMPSASGCGTCLTKMAGLQAQAAHTQQMEALGRMASGMVHEFRNFLTVILGCTEMLLDRVKSDPQSADLARQVFSASQNAAALTNQLLAFGRPLQIRPEVVDLNLAVAQLITVLRCTLGTGTSLHIVPASVPCPVTVDLGQLKQVLLNLVINARDAMPKGGAITVEIAAANLGAERAAARPAQGSGQFVTLAVSDTGQGMDAATQQRIFEPFFTTKEQGKGTGLGLSVVYGIVQKQFGGTISLESTPGHGSTFTIHLPRAVERTN
ncbi:MAG: MEDS domain-containing protein [Acidobacteriia bacterium]|nr:MEDS domain-containing protein [Terriglobia bacterium]